MTHTRYDPVMDIITADIRGRVTLSRKIAAPGTTYRIETEEDGTIILTPVKIIDTASLPPEIQAAIADITG